jgi:hypothetical protein
MTSPALLPRRKIAVTTSLQTFISNLLGGHDSEIPYRVETQKADHGQERVATTPHARPGMLAHQKHVGRNISMAEVTESFM